MTFGERLKKALKSKGMTQSDLASAIGVSKSAICQFATDRNLPGTKTTAKIADVLGVSFDVLLNGTKAISKEIVWHYPDDQDDPDRLPKSMDFVLALVTGMAGGRHCEDGPFIASFAPDDGWVLDTVSDRPDDNWKVTKWMAIPWEDNNERC